MTVDNDRLFKWGVVSLLAYPLLSMIPIFSPLFFPSEMSLWLFEFLLRVSTLLVTCAAYACIAGFLMIVAHYFRTGGRETKRYRGLDYLVIVALIVLLAGTASIFWAYFIAERPPYYEGFVRYLHLGWFVCLGASVLGWAYGLWRLRIRWMMLCSVSALALSFFPQIPYNAPEFIEAFMMPAEYAPDPAASLEITDEQPPLDATIIQDGENAAGLENTTATRSIVHLGGVFPFLLVVVYTWMRWSGRVLKRDPFREGADSNALPHPAGGWAYVMGEAYLLLALPLVIVTAIGLSGLQTQRSLFSYNTLALLEAGLVAVTAVSLLLVLPRQGRLSPERLEKTDRGFRRIVLLLILFPVGSSLAIVYDRMTGGTLNPSAAVGLGSLFHALIRQGVLLAAVLLWFRGVQKKQALLAVSGGILFVVLFSPPAVLSTLYPHVPFPPNVEVSTNNDHPVLEEGGKDMPQDNTTASASDAARFCERMRMPWGTNRAHFIFFPRYIHLHASALLLFTLMRFWADVFSEKQASQPEEPALA